VGPVTGFFFGFAGILITVRSHRARRAKVRQARIRQAREVIRIRRQSMFSARGQT